ncbi:hypothetical protein FGE12_26480 [Aggregicoccus sp. 17bor-14]|uniref:hypothetical protein n=1 Tax=Myxococcaceae TaxID=31 RepID=UPI00129C36CC|nr:MULTISPECIES: hypothetical protein [Myxococcaceae]MBF5045987.1 hypothetical protein [Simulacricoccus sp. 17bor-14]MRI91718.1 hypothetical protein [Aggregicoccus sp. 17bor-14]
MRTAQEERKGLQPLACSGLLLRCYRSALERLGRLPQTLAALPQESAALFREPPAPQQWVPGRWLVELSEALRQGVGREGCRRVGFEVAREVSSGAMRPLVSTLVALHRARLQGVYERLGLVANLLLRGPVLLYTPETERTGSLGIVHAEPVPDALYALWEGCLVYVHHLCGVEGGVGRARLGPDGSSSLVSVSW